MRWRRAFGVAVLSAVLATATPARPFEADAAARTFLDDLSRRSCDYFLEKAHPRNGLIPDRGRADGSPSESVASIAATGFGLAALCVAEHRGWIGPDEARARAERTLAFALRSLPHERGFFYRYMDLESGERAWDTDASSIDTALFLAGALLCGEYFAHPGIHGLANALYERVEWPWMLNGGRTLSIGWTPESGFLPDRWDTYSEHMLLYLLGLGSPTHPLPAETWTAWRRVPVLTYGGRTFIQCPPLFTHQYSQAFVDFRGKRDAFADYFLNSRLATLAQRDFCADLAEHFPKMGPLTWGLTAADGPHGYQVWGGPPPTPKAPIDGTVVPCAVTGSLPFAPEACLPTLLDLRERHGDRIWKKYGFVDSFNPHTDWTAPDVIGIDLGITVVMLENFRDGFAWRHLARNGALRRGMDRAGFVEGPANANPQVSLVDPPCRPESRRPEPPVAVAGRFAGWDRMTWHHLDRCHLDFDEDGAEAADATARFAFAWDATNLYFAIEVEDRSPFRGQSPERLYDGDGVELFVDPAGDALRWSDLADFQFGFSPLGFAREWFGGRNNVAVSACDTDTGYRIEASLPWDLLGFAPAPGAVLRATPSVINRYAKDGQLKLNWHWDVNLHTFRLGKVRLE